MTKAGIKAMADLILAKHSHGERCIDVMLTDVETLRRYLRRQDNVEMHLANIRYDNICNELFRVYKQAWDAAYKIDPELTVCFSNPNDVKVKE